MQAVTPSAISHDAALCRAVLGTSALRYDPVADRETSSGCGFTNAVRIRATSAAVGDAFTLTCRSAVALALWEEHVLQPLARAYFDSCLAALEPMARKDPDDPRVHSALGVAYAGIGRKQDAIREGLAAVEMMPMQRDVVKGYNHEWELARIYTMTGAHEQAIAMLEHLLEVPGYLTAAWLRMDPTWDPLRGQPRFQRLVGGAK